MYVRNIGSDVDENLLRSVFGKFGGITSTVVMRNGSGKSRGFGFVNFEKSDHAAAAVDGMNGYRRVLGCLKEPQSLSLFNLAWVLSRLPVTLTGALC